MPENGLEMAESTAQQLADKPAATSAELAIRRAYQRRLGRRPTTLERSLIERLARYETLALDPATSIADAYRLESVLRRARVEFDAITAKPEPAKLGPNSLAEYAASKRAAASA